MSYDWVFFDADGTLFDYEAAERAALEGAFAFFRLPLPASAGSTYSGINAAIWREYERGEITQAKLRTIRFDRLFEELGLSLDSEEFSGRYLEILGRQAGLLEDAEEVVRTLSLSVGLVLITNGLAEVQRPRFAASSIGSCFIDIVVSEEVGLAKPDPAIFDLAFERIGRPAKDRVLMVGDNLGSDIIGGVGYGLDTCWYNPRGTANGHGVEPSYEIRELRQILDLV